MITKQIAEKIADEVEDQLMIVDPALDRKRMLRIATYTVDRMKSVIPMYTGNLNPTWKKYHEAALILKNRLMSY